MTTALRAVITHESALLAFDLAADKQVRADRPGLAGPGPAHGGLTRRATLAAILGYCADGLPYRAPYPWVPGTADDAESAAAVAAALGTRAWRVVARLVHRDNRRVWVESVFNTAKDRPPGGTVRVAPSATSPRPGAPSRPTSRSPRSAGSRPDRVRRLRD
jgi:hypothetical protein